MWRTMLDKTYTVIRIQSGLPGWNRIIFILWTTLLLPCIEGCYRKPSYTVMTTTTVPTTTYPYDRRLDCTDSETVVQRCYNGGTCHALEVEGKSRITFCDCSAEFYGPGCEYFYIDPSILAVSQIEDNSLLMQVTQLKLRTARIAAGVTVAILIIFVVILSAYVFLRKKRKSRRHTVQLNTQEEGDNLTDVKPSSPPFSHRDNNTMPDGATNFSQKDELSGSLHPKIQNSSPNNEEQTETML